MMENSEAKSVDCGSAPTEILTFVSEQEMIKAGSDEDGDDDISGMKMADVVVTVMNTRTNSDKAELKRSLTSDRRSKSVESMRLQKSRYVFTEKVVRSKSGIVKAVSGYVVTEELGRGAFGAVYKVEKNAPGSTIPTQYAMKIFLNNSKTEVLRRVHPKKEEVDPRDVMLREIAIMKRLHHPHLVHLVEVVEETSDPFSIFVVMEYASIGPIMRARKQPFGCIDPPAFYSPVNEDGVYGEAQASGLFRELVSAMAYLHLNNVAHRDLKPDNVVLTESLHVKIVDFGVSKCFSEDGFFSGSSCGSSGSSGMVNDLQGTWPFWAPEMCPDADLGEAGAGLERRKFSAYATDVWAAGVVLWVMVFGSLPFFAATPEEIFAQIRGPLPDAPVRKSPELMALLMAMLKTSVSERPDFTACQHFAWVQSYTTDSIERNIADYHNYIDLSDLDIHEAITKATTVQLKQEFVTRLHQRVVHIREKIQNSTVRRKSVHSEDSAKRQLLFMGEGGGSQSFLFDSITNGDVFGNPEDRRQSINVLEEKSDDGSESFLEEISPASPVSSPATTQGKPSIPAAEPQSTPTPPLCGCCVVS